MSTVAERVAAGAAYLDEREPGWWQRIDLDRLNLQAPCQCVLGQLGSDRLTDGHEDEWTGICDLFGISPPWYQATPSYPADWTLGFNAPRDDDPSRLVPDFRDYDLLTAEWRRYISERRAGDSR